jgi:hypothetical protein
MTPAFTHSTMLRNSSKAWPSMSHCVATLYFLAAAPIARISDIVRACGFSQATCLPISMALMEITAWV